MKKRLIVFQSLFLIAVAAVLLLTLLRAVAFSDELYTYENRQAEQLPLPGISSFLDTTYQDSVESALSDQAPFSQQLKSMYNKTEAYLSLQFVRQLAEQNPDEYLPFNSLQIFGGDMLTYAPVPLDEQRRAQLDQKIHSINTSAADHPEVDFYAYYIEKDTDIDFETEEKTGYYSYVRAGIDPAQCKVAAFNIDNFEQFRKYFYKSDHHWNHVGSYKAYEQLVEFLEIGERPLAKGEEFLVGDTLSGSKAMVTKTSGIWQEEMHAYRYDFPALDVCRNGNEEAVDYGMQNQPIDGAAYGSYYGGDDGELILRNNAPEKDNILIIGESYDNAILKLLAGHFDHTYSVDLRYYEAYMGHAFDFDSYLKAHEIDKVLFIGNIDYYTMSEFNVR